MSTSVEIPKAAPTSAAELALPSGGQGTDPSIAQGLSLWLENFRKYETTLQEVAKASTGTKYKAELGTIQQWYRVLPEVERTATVHALLQESSPDQLRFYIAAIQQMVRPEAPKTEVFEEVKPKERRPPSLNIPALASPTTPTPVTAKEATPFPHETETEQRNEVDAEKSDTSQTVDNKPTENDRKDTEATQSAAGLPALGLLNPLQLNMLKNAGLTAEAQLLAIQLIMSGVVQPSGTISSQRQPSGRKPSHLGEAKTWRTPSSAKYPKSALHSGGLRATALKSASLKSAGLPSAGLQSAGLKSSSGSDTPLSATPREDEFNPALLDDIPAWLRSLRLHKYTSCFDGLNWQEMVVLDDAALEAKGVVALGARRRLLRTFEHAKKKMGMEAPDSATPTTGIPPQSGSVIAPEVSQASATAPTSKLSITSPVFVPLSERGAQHANPTFPDNNGLSS